MHFTLYFILLHPSVSSQTSTATKHSKFGLPIVGERNIGRLVKLFADNEWLEGVHIHVGSQGVPVHKLVEAAKVTRAKQSGLIMGQLSLPSKCRVQ